MTFVFIAYRISLYEREEDACVHDGVYIRLLTAVMRLGVDCYNS